MIMLNGTRKMQRTQKRLTHAESVEARELMKDATLEEFPDKSLVKGGHFKQFAI